MTSHIYKYDGKDFFSIRELSEYTKINEKTLTARLRRGMPIENACENIDLRCSYHLDDGVKKSVTQICKDHDKDVDLVKNRLRYGYSLNDALNRPKKISKQGIPIVVNGILYNSIAEAARKLNLTHKESTIRRKLKEGVKTDEVFKKAI